MGAEDDHRRPHAGRPKVRVAVVIPEYGTMGGAERFVFELTERLVSRDHFEIHVFASQWQKANSRVMFHKVPRIRFPHWMQPVSFAWFAQRAVRSKDFDIVHSHERIFEYDILTHHGLPHRYWMAHVRKKRMGLYDRATARIEQMGIQSPRRPMILPVSTLAKKQLQWLFNIPDSRIQVIHPGVTAKEFGEVRRERCRREIRHRHGLSPRDVVVLFVGMNFDVKGLDRILKGMACFTENNRRHHNLKLLVVGKGNVRRYRSMARKLKIEGRVVFAGTRHKAAEYFLAGDLLAHMAYGEAFGMVILEAMMAGLPVMISDRVGARDVVEHGVTGYIVGGDRMAHDMSARLSDLMDPTRRKEMGEKARQVAARHDWDRVAEQVARLYMKRMERKKEISRPAP